MHAGVGLIEVVVALSIGSAAVLLGYGALAAVFDTRAHVARRVLAETRATTLRNHLQTMLASAHTTPGEAGRSFTVGDADGDGYGESLAFITTAQPFPGPTGVELRWIENDGRAELVALTGVGGRQDTLRVSRWISSMRVRVRTDEGWSGQWTSSVLLPHAVEVLLRTSSPDSLSAAVEVPITIRLHATQ